MAKGSTTKPPAKEIEKSSCRRRSRLARFRICAELEWLLRDGYDPDYMFWMGEPYKATDKAAQDYIALLRSERRAREDRRKPIRRLQEPMRRRGPSAVAAAAPVKPEANGAKAEPPATRSFRKSPRNCPRKTTFPIWQHSWHFLKGGSEFQGVIREISGRPQQHCPAGSQLLPVPPTDALPGMIDKLGPRSSTAIGKPLCAS